jgi:hypothetical protein
MDNFTEFKPYESQNQVFAERGAMKTQSEFYNMSEIDFAQMCVNGERIAIVDLGIQLMRLNLYYGMHTTKLSQLLDIITIIKTEEENK